VLGGQRAAYVCAGRLAEVSVPATLQAAIAARIDRLHPMAKRTLWAAAVIGSRLSADLLAALRIDPVLDDPLRTELIDQIVFGPHAEQNATDPELSGQSPQKGCLPCPLCWPGWTGSKSIRSSALPRRPTPTPDCTRWMRYTWPMLKSPHPLHH
jgi:hypothetical protein